MTNSSYELNFLKIRAKYEYFLNKNTSKIRVKIRVKLRFLFLKKRVNSTRDIFMTKVRESAHFLMQVHSTPMQFKIQQHVFLLFQDSRIVAK